MIKEYNDGVLFIEDNIEILNQKPYLATFFYLDAKEIKNVDENNYLFKVINQDKTLLALKLSPYDLLLLGAKECLGELLKHLDDFHYNVDKILCETLIGDALVKEHGYFKEIGMDFMETKTKANISSGLVTIPTIDDAKELELLMQEFHLEAGVSGSVNIEKIITLLPNTRIIKQDGKIVSFARCSYNTDTSERISYVYTRPAYRNKGYARMIVGTIQNEIISNGKIATLNVDQNNPISNHIYESLGFKKVHSQGIYVKIK